MTPPSPADLVDRRSERRQAEGALFSLEADRSHLEREKSAIGAALLGFRQSIQRTEAAIREQEAKLERIDSKMFMLDQDIQRAKKKMRLL